MQLLNNQDPNYLNKLGGFARTPQEGANIVQTGVENQRIGMETQGAEARRDKTRQDIAQSGQLFPGMQEEQRLGNQRIQSDINLKGAQMQTEGALAGKANAEAANVGKSGGMDAGEYQRAVRAHYNAATDYFGRLSGSKDIFGNETPPYTPEQAKAVETILNRDAQRLGLPDQYGYEVTQGPAERDTRTGESLPGPQVITPRVSQRKNVSQMNDDEVLNAMKSYDVPQQARARRQALQEEIHKATDRIPETPEGNMRAKAIAAEIARRFLKELSGGE
jgi:hypothetical protein